MAEPVETIIICVQQSFEIAGGLNPVQIKTEYDRVWNMLKKYKNARYKINTARTFISSISKKWHWTDIYNL